MRAYSISVLFFSVLSVSLWQTSPSSAGPLPDTKPLTWDGDLSLKMVDGIHAYLDREIADSVKKRQTKWKPDLSSPEAYLKSVEPNRQRLRKLLGVVEERLPPDLQYVGGPDQPSLVATADKYTVRAVRWAVLPGVDAEGLLLEPNGDAIADVVAIPDADQTPEQIVGLGKGLPNQAHHARRLAEAGCRVLVPTLIDRKDTYSGSARFNRWTNQPHREFVYRMAFEMGRTLIGYEVQKVLAAIDWFRRDEGKTPVGVFGYGEGGVIAMYAAAIDPRIDAVVISGSFGPREGIADEPIYRNVWGLLTEFGDGDVLRLIFPRSAIIEWSKFTIDGPPKATPTRFGAAPGKVENATLNSVHKEWKRVAEPLSANYKHTRNNAGLTEGVTIGDDAPATAGSIPDDTLQSFVFGLTTLDKRIVPPSDPPTDSRKNFDPEPRHKRQFDQLVTAVQKLWRDSEFVRAEFFKDADISSLDAWDKSCDRHRKYLHDEIIGRLPAPTLPPNPRTRQVYDEPKFTGHEVVLDLHPDVFAYGIVLLPKDLKPGEKRPAVVCQHGLEGTPRKCIDPEERPVYDQFARKLVEKGYVVYCPQNPYYGGDHFRQAQRKANAVGLSLFSFIVAQHSVALDWLQAQHQVDPDRIGFYGLSYGGKTAMRVPALEKRYKAVVCAGDFNEWIGKIVSVDFRASYMFTKEYEIGEFNLGHTFNYAEMAGLIAPRAFMVERGHDDGVGIDPWVASEYAKVRYLYANRLKIPDRTTIEFSVGGHRNFCKGSFDFLDKHLGPIRP